MLSRAGQLPLPFLIPAVLPEPEESQFGEMELVKPVHFHEGLDCRGLFLHSDLSQLVLFIFPLG